MKKSVVIFATIVVFMASFGFAEDAKKGPTSGQPPCPKTTFVSDCFTCHAFSGGKLVLKDSPPDAHITYPAGVKITGWDTGKYRGYFLLEDINDKAVQDYFNFLRRYRIKDAVIEVQSPGGGLFSAQRMLGLIEEWRAEGGTLETKCLGISASAGFMLFVAGDKGKRFVCPNSDLMWHEVRTLEGWGMRVATPTSKEEEGRVFRHLQNIRNTWLATRGNLTKDELDKRVAWKDWWMSGKDAKELGFADGFIGKQP